MIGQPAVDRLPLLLKKARYIFDVKDTQQRATLVASVLVYSFPCLDFRQRSSDSAAYINISEKLL